LSSKPRFCSNCGEKLDTDEDIEECPKCHTALHEHSQHLETSKSVVEQLPYKSPGTAALTAFLGGIFALPGIGHIYVGKVGRGIGVLVSGLILYALTVTSVFSVGFLAGFENPNAASYSSVGLGAIAVMLILSVIYNIIHMANI